jgi:predicted DNA-binding protein (MmcQ/YjbR family)
LTSGAQYSDHIEMGADRVRAICLKFPHATEQIQWGDNLVFKVSGKMFAVANLEGAGNGVAFKTSPEEFAMLTEQEGIVPAPYLARAHWVSLATFDILSPTELQRRLQHSYDLVFSRLPRSAQAALRGESVARGVKKSAQAGLLGESVARKVSKGTENPKGARKG